MDIYIYIYIYIRLPKVTLVLDASGGAASGSVPGRICGPGPEVGAALALLGDVQHHAFEVPYMYVCTHIYIYIYIYTYTYIHIYIHTYRY